ncbi:luciferase-like domain-containing protein [Aspergillus germanicus]
MFTVGHLSFGQWRHPSDRSATKPRDLSYWTNLAKILEKGDFNALFLADSFGLHDTYQGSGDTAIREGPVTAMASVTKNLGFAITTSTSYEAPYVVAKRFSTLDHLTGVRFGWNIVTSWKATLIEDPISGIYTDPTQIKAIYHASENFTVDAPHILDPSPQRTPFLFQAGTSPAGIAFGAKHAEGIFVSAPSPHILAPRVKAIREAAAKNGRNPGSLKVFAIFTPILGRTDEEAKAKYEEALKYASVEGGLAFYSSNIGVDPSKFPLDAEITPSDIHIDARVHSSINTLPYHGADVPKWAPRNIGKAVSIGGNGPVAVGTVEKDVVELVVPELSRRGVYAPKGESGTMRGRVYGQG